jgi:PAS domain S-box-containing protein
MQVRWFSAVFLCCLLVFVAWQSLAQQSVAQPSAVQQPTAAFKLTDQPNLIFDRLSTGAGLSNAGVRVITQDQHGFIWIGTQEGLNKYDGYTFETFFHEPENTDSLSHHSVWDILSRSDGSLWVATNHGLNRYDEASRTFETVWLGLNENKKSARHNRIKVLFEDSENRFWLGTELGLAQYLPGGDFVHYHHDASNPASVGAGPVRAIYEDSTGRLWVGSEQGGLNLFDPVDGSFTQFNDDSSIRSIIEDADGKIWVATFNRGIRVFDPGTREFSSISSQSPVPIPLLSGRTRVLFKDQNEQVWIGTDSGLYLYSRGLFTLFANDPTDTQSLGNNTIVELFQDQGGVIWVGTYNGISKWNAKIETFPHFKHDASQRNGLLSNFITAFAETNAGDIWIGTFSGLNKWYSDNGTFARYAARDIGLSDGRVMSLAMHGDDLWVGTMFGGISVIRNDKVVSSFVHDPNDENSLGANPVSAMLTNSRGETWVTTYGGGLNKYLEDGKFQRYPKHQNPDRHEFLKTVDIVESGDGSLWVATDKLGVFVLDPETGDTRNIRHDPSDPNSLSSNNIGTMLATKTGVWIGTRDSGLNFYDITTNTITRRSRSHGLASDIVFGLLEDSIGRVWISGGQGLSVYDPGTDTFVLYNATHGLQNDDFNSGTVLELKDGSFLFGGGGGFNAFYPNNVIGNTYVPPLRITRFSKFNKRVFLPEPVFRSENIELAYNDSVIGFDFAAMDFTSPEKNRFRYFMEGFDKDWVEADGAHTVTFTNLDYGDYVFKVMGSNNDGVWNETGTSIKIKVNPPMWATWWAYLVYFLVGVGVLYQTQKANETRLRRIAEKRYSERLQLYIESLEEATDCVLIADANHHLMYANTAIDSILGVTPSNAVGRSILCLLFSDPEDANLASTGLREHGRWHGEVRTRKGDQYVTTDISIAAVRDDSDNETAYVSISRDITERKQTEAELEKHRLNLEWIVGERTVALKHEIAENKAVQVELANSLKEKELLLKEVHHRVKNNMQVISSLLNIQAETVGDEVFAGLLGESQQRIKSMAMIHENFYQSDNLSEIDFGDYINMLANSLHRFYAVKGEMVNLDIQVDNIALDLETAVPCGIIINELISNSLKHAFKGRESRGTVSVRFKNVDCSYILQIEDDGVGLPDGFTLDSSTSMGMEIVSILTQQLDGRLQYESANGAFFEISFPRKEKHVSEVPAGS